MKFWSVSKQADEGNQGCNQHTVTDISGDSNVHTRTYCYYENYNQINVQLTAATVMHSSACSS